MNALMIHSQMMIHSLPTLVLGSLIKITLVLLAAWVAGYLLRRSSAATRHLVWSVALGGVLLVPLLSLSLPQWKVAWGHASAAAPMAAPQAPLLPLAPTDAPAVSQVAPPSAPASEKSEGLPAVTAVSRAVPVPTSGHQFPTVTYTLGIGLFAWLIGLLSVLCQLFVGLSRLARIERRSLPLENGELRLAEDVRGRMGLRRPVRFLRATEANAIAVPVTWGVFRPVVLLPAQSSAWSEDCLRAALLHELAHVQRWDWPTQLMGRLACALYWWHPLVLWAARRAREESERACDDLVLGMGMKAADYAQRLVEVVRSMPEGAPSRTVAIAMAQPSEVEGRVQAVLAKGRNRTALSRRRWTIILGVVGVLLLPLAALKPVAQAAGQTDGESPSPLKASVERRIGRGILEFVYLKDVATDSYPARPFNLEPLKDAEGHTLYQMVNAKTGQRSRDFQAVQADFQKLLDQGYTPRRGTAPYLIPLNLSIDVPKRKVFFTPQQRKQAEDLEREKKAFISLLQDSPVIVTDADLDKATAGMNGQAPSIPELELTFTPDGTQKMKAFSTSHTGELMGILADGRLLLAPRVIGPMEGKSVISGGFRDLTEAKALADSLSQPMGREQITPTGYHATWPDGTQIVLEGGAADAVPAAVGYQATLANGYTVGVEGVTEAVAKDEEWSMYGGPWWEPNGMFLPQPLENSVGGLWHWSVHQHGGIAPFLFRFTVTPRQTVANTPAQEISTYEEFIGTDGPAEMRDHPPFTRDEGPMSGETLPAYFTPSTRACTIRYGVAAGPWQTAATVAVHLTPATVRASQQGHPYEHSAVTIKLDDRPALLYQEADGTHRTVYFLGAEHLGNVARRVVAVDGMGNAIPLKVTGNAAWGLRLITLGFSASFALSYFNPDLKLAQVKEFRLETRPYQIAEFRNVQLQPRVTVGPSSQAPLLGGEQAGKGRRSWIAPPNEATARPLTFENRVGGRLLSVLHAQNGYDPLTATLLQVTMTNYRKDGSIRSLIECKQAEWRGGVLTMHEATIRDFGNNSAQTMTVRARIMTLNPENSTLTVAGGGVATSVGAGSWDSKEQRSLSNLKRIDLTIQEYIQDNDKRLPPLRTLPALENALMPYLKQQEKFPDPATGQPFRVRGRDLFVSPLTGQPYLLAAALSGRPISQVADPASMVLLRDTLRTPSGAIQCVLEAFADGHVKGRFYDSKGGGRVIQ